MKTMPLPGPGCGHNLYLLTLKFKEREEITPTLPPPLLFSNNTQMTSKNGKNRKKSLRTGAIFDVIQKIPSVWNSCGFCGCFHYPLRMFQQKKKLLQIFFSEKIYPSVDILCTKIATPKSLMKILSIYLNYLFRREANFGMDVFDLTESNKKRKLSSIWTWLSSNRKT